MGDKFPSTSLECPLCASSVCGGERTLFSHMLEMYPTSFGHNPASIESTFWQFPVSSGRSVCTEQQLLPLIQAVLSHKYIVIHALPLLNQ
jgi:hypothetical protein